MSSVTVVMTTYNGEKYILEQLDSIRIQTRQPNEVLIFDDVSTDNTYEIVRKYLLRYDLKSWRVQKNSTNKGWKKNFIDAMASAKGDFIFLSDQDDIWIEDKIESMTSILERNKNINLLYGTSEIFYSEKNEKKSRRPFYSFRKKTFYLDSMWNGRGISSKINKFLKGNNKYSEKVVNVPFEPNIFNIQKQGCVMAVRKDFFNAYKNFWTPDCPHDSLIWFCSAMTGSLYYFDKPVIKYRHHNNNTGFADTIGEGQTRNKEIKKILEFLNLLEKFSAILETYKGQNKENVCAVMYEIKQCYKDRLNFLKTRVLSKYNLIIKRKQVIGIRQMLFDLLLAYLA